MDKCEIQSYQRTFPIQATADGEQLLAKDIVQGRFLWLQNNTSYDANVLVFPDAEGTKDPLQVALRSGGSTGIETTLGSFQVWTSVLNVSGTPILPAGAGGIYQGRGSTSSKQPSTGYITVLGYTEPVSIQVAEGDLQRVTINQKPITNFIEWNINAENVYSWQGLADSSVESAFTTINTIEQVRRMQLIVNAPFRLGIQLQWANNTLANNLYTIPVNAGRSVLDLSDWAQTTGGVTANGIPKGTQFKVGTVDVAFYGTRPQVTVRCITQVVKV